MARDFSRELEFGELGMVIYSAAESSSTEVFSALQATEDSVIEVTTVGNSAPIVALTLLGGMSIYGTFEGLTVTSGNVIAYKRK